MAAFERDGAVLHCYSEYASGDHSLPATIAEFLA
jgi:hypothetical protein